MCTPMPTIELNKALDSLQMAKRQKTDADNVSEKEEPFPTEPSDIVKGLVLSAYRRPDINEIKYSVDEDITSLQPLSTPLSDSELPPMRPHKQKKEKKKGSKDKESVLTTDSENNGDNATQTSTTDKTLSRPHSSKESGMDES